MRALFDERSAIDLRENANRPIGKLFVSLFLLTANKSFWFIRVVFFYSRQPVVVFILQHARARARARATGVAGGGTTYSGPAAVENFDKTVRVGFGNHWSAEERRNATAAARNQQQQQRRHEDPLRASGRLYNTIFPTLCCQSSCSVRRAEDVCRCKHPLKHISVLFATENHARKEGGRVARFFSSTTSLATGKTFSNKRVGQKKKKKRYWLKR